MPTPRSASPADAAPEPPRVNPQAVYDAVRAASLPQKIALAAAGVAVVATVPLWGPPLWRSKTVRRLAMAGASRTVTGLMG